jgi:hypothetical protein
VSADYEVGYGKPPKAGQFQKGKSGNPKGRRKGSKSLKGIFNKVLYQSVMVQQGEKQNSVPVVQALMMSQVKQAMHGKTRAFELLLKLAEQLGMMTLEEEPAHPSTQELPSVVWTEKHESLRPFIEHLINDDKPIIDGQA